MTTATAASNGNENEERKFSDKEMIIEYKYNRIASFAIKPAAAETEEESFLPFVYHDTLSEDNSSKPIWEYDYITISQEPNPYARYHVTYYVADNRDLPNAGKSKMIKEEWYPMTSTVLEIEHYS